MRTLHAKKEKKEVKTNKKPHPTLKQQSPSLAVQVWKSRCFLPSPGRVKSFAQARTVTSRFPRCQSSSCSDSQAARRTVGSSRGHRARGRRGGPEEPHHVPQLCRGPVACRELGTWQTALNKCQSFRRPARRSCLCLTSSGKEGKNKNNKPTKSKSIDTPVR